VVSLTFDDGPDPEVTPAVLAALDRAGATATFFVVAEQIDRPEGPDLLRAVLAAGHDVQVHGGTHTPHPQLAGAELRADLDRALGALCRLRVPAPRLWRPPYGRLHPRHSHAVAVERGLQLILWTHDTGDYDGRRWRTMLAGASAALYHDSVILMHDSRRYARVAGAAETVALVEPLAAAIAARGFAIGRLASDRPARAPRPGETVRLIPPPPLLAARR
jgi:peptidoglycan-N-acetylglucosamine deacetylase